MPTIFLYFMFIFFLTNVQIHYILTRPVIFFVIFPYCYKTSPDKKFVSYYYFFLFIIYFTIFTSCTLIIAIIFSSISLPHSFYFFVFLVAFPVSSARNSSICSPITPFRDNSSSSVHVARAILSRRQPPLLHPQLNPIIQESIIGCP